MSRRQLGEDIRLFHRRAQLFIREAADLRARQHRRGGQPHAAADGEGGLRIIAGHDLRGHAQPFEILYGLRRGALRRVEKGEVAHERHIIFIGEREPLLSAELLFRHGDHLHALFQHLVHNGGDAALLVFPYGDGLTAVFDEAAA